MFLRRGLRIMNTFTDTCPQVNSVCDVKLHCPQARGLQAFAFACGDSSSALCALMLARRARSSTVSRWAILSLAIPIPAAPPGPSERTKLHYAIVFVIVAQSECRRRRSRGWALGPLSFGPRGGKWKLATRWPTSLQFSSVPCLDAADYGVRIALCPLAGSACQRLLFIISPKLQLARRWSKWAVQWRMRVTDGEWRPRKGVRKWAECRGHPHCLSLYFFSLGMWRVPKEKMNLRQFFRTRRKAWYVSPRQRTHPREPSGAPQVSLTTDWLVHLNIPERAGFVFYALLRVYHPPKYFLNPEMNFEINILQYCNPACVRGGESVFNHVSSSSFTHFFRLEVSSSTLRER